MNYELKYMQRCIQLAKCGVMGAPPNPMVGAVVVHEGKIIGEGFHIKPVIERRQGSMVVVAITE